jgi:hypothetical protein
MWATEIARSPREGLAATKRIVASLCAGHAGREPEAYATALGTLAAQARLRAFRERRGLPR